MALLTGFNIANVERAKVVTKETTPRTLQWETMVSFEAEPYVEEGEEVVQRIRNTVLGRIKTDDLVGGYNVSCEDEHLIPDILALVDGGSYDSTTETYSGPVAGAGVSRVAFDLYLYSSSRGTGGAVTSYLEYKFPNCKGKPVKLGSKNMEFRKTPYEIESRADTGESAVTVKKIEALPATT